MYLSREAQKETVMIVMKEEATPDELRAEANQFRHGEGTVIDIDGRKVGGRHRATICRPSRFPLR
jgi:hypothetical protein